MYGYICIYTDLLAMPLQHNSLIPTRSYTAMCCNYSVATKHEYIHVFTHTCIVTTLLHTNVLLRKNEFLCINGY